MIASVFESVSSKLAAGPTMSLQTRFCALIWSNLDCHRKKRTWSLPGNPKFPWKRQVFFREIQSANIATVKIKTIFPKRNLKNTNCKKCEEKNVRANFGPRKSGEKRKRHLVEILILHDIIKYSKLPW